MPYERYVQPGKFDDEISAIIREDRGYLLISSVEAHGIHREYAYQYLRDRGGFTKLDRGVYVSPSAIPDIFYSFCLRNRKAVLSHEAALYIHGLIGSWDHLITATVPQGYNAKHITTLKEASIYYIDSARFNIGTIRRDSPLGNPVTVYDPERTICDIIRERKYAHRMKDDLMFIRVLQKYFSDRFPHDTLKLFEYSEAFGVTKKVNLYRDMLLNREGEEKNGR